MSGARLDLAGVGKSFRGLRAVHDVSFTVPAGAIHALIGPNGAGKTTIFNMIAGAFAPDAGTVSLDGKVDLRACGPTASATPASAAPSSS